MNPFTMQIKMANLLQNVGPHLHFATKSLNDISNSCIRKWIYRLKALVHQYIPVQNGRIHMCYQSLQKILFNPL